MVVCVFITGIDVWKFYLVEILPRGNQGDATSAAFTINYQSAQMFFKYLFVEDSIDNPAPLFESLLIFKISILIFKIIVLGLTILFTISNSNQHYKVWSLWVLIAILLSPYGSSYTYLLLIFSLMSFYPEKKSLWLYLLIILVINIPVNYLYNFPLLFQFPKLYLVVGIFIFIVSSARVSWDKKKIIPWVLFSTVISLVTVFSDSPDRSNYLLTLSNPPLITGYHANNNLLLYHYWTPSGIQEGKTDIQVNTLSNTSVQIVDNQINYKGVSLTDSRDKKKQASLLNDSTIIYLSDKGRGYGFYAFRQLSVN